MKNIFDAGKVHFAVGRIAICFAEHAFFITIIAAAKRRNGGFYEERGIS